MGLKIIGVGIFDIRSVRKIINVLGGWDVLNWGYGDGIVIGDSKVREDYGSKKWG